MGVVGRIQSREEEKRIKKVWCQYRLVVIQLLSLLGNRIDVTLETEQVLPSGMFVLRNFL